ncbi:hypothetical protein ACF1DY_20205 [Streptomyces albus]|uniref:hypothetical protein n=1 Tax=Streptomyces albus TaxID=1888 RepID=UPI0036F53C52
MTGQALTGVTLTAAHPAKDTVEGDWRFAELSAQCFLDPALAARYTAEPRRVLAEFGIPTDADTRIPALPTGCGAEVTITSLDPRETVGRTTDCSSWTYAPPNEPAIPLLPAAPAVRATPSLPSM